LKDFELELVSELIRNCRRSDRQLAKVLGVSQPTVTRMRMKLEKKELLEYSACPNLARLGYTMMAVVFGKRDYEKHPEDVSSKALKFVDEHPNVIFASDGNGLDFDRIAISLHRNYSEYSAYIQEMRSEVKDIMNLESFLIDLATGGVLRPLCMKTLADDLEKQKTLPKAALRGNVAPKQE